ncbi:MAG: amidohydrolase family protein, partial [Bryobacterales bacterium]|nr:amidohydrolase family protein [Bryobacterales bacterium]
VAVPFTSDVGETRWLLEITRACDIVLGVSGSAGASDAARTLDELMRQAHFKAVALRPGSLRDPMVLSTLEEAARRNLPVDLILDWQQLADLPALWDRTPNLRAAVAHLDSLPLEPAALDQWADWMDQAVSLPGLYLKLSGLLRPEGLQASVAALTSCVRLLMRLFGPARLMFASGWPFCLLGAGKWKESLAAFTQMLGPQPMEAREALLGGTACAFYRLA